MGKVKRIGQILLRRATLLLTVKAMLTMLVFVYGATFVTTTTNYSASIGGAINVTNSLKAIDKGFSRAGSGSSAAGTSCGSPVTFGPSPGTANNAITAGNIVFTIQVNSTGSTPQSTCFSVNLKITPSGGAQQDITVYIATDSTPANDEVVDCKFDVGGSVPSSPYSFKVTVQTG